MPTLHKSDQANALNYSKLDIINKRKAQSTITTNTQHLIKTDQNNYLNNY